MSATLFKRPNFEGERFAVSADVGDLKTTAVGAGTSSIRLTDSRDRLLCFTRKNWHGEPMFRRGPVDIAKVADPDRHGKRGMGNSISAVRVTPFTLRLNVHVIQSSSGALPGTLTSEDDARGHVQRVVDAASAIWSDSLIRLQVAKIAFATDDRFFNLNNQFLELLVTPEFEIDERAANVFLVNTIGHNNDGVAEPRWVSQRLAIDAVADGLLLAHELGHFLGLEHKRPQKHPGNLMNHLVSDSELDDDQVEHAQRHLARRAESQAGVRF